MSAQRADAAAAGLAAALARMAEVRGGGADGGGDDDGGAKSGPRQISYKQERATHDQASARECHRPTQRRSQECRAARARRARRRGRATATGRHDQKPRGGGWGSRRGSPTTPQASHALMRRPADAARLTPVRCHAPLPPRRARRRRDAPAAAAAPARNAIRARASPRLPHATPYYPHDPPRPPRERASVLNRGDSSPLYTRRPGTYKRERAARRGRDRAEHSRDAAADGHAPGRQ